MKHFDMRHFLIFLFMAMFASTLSAKSSFVQVRDGHFVRDGKPYYYVGTNFWYGAILASEGQGGNRERLRDCFSRILARKCKLLSK